MLIYKEKYAIIVQSPMQTFAPSTQANQSQERWFLVKTKHKSIVSVASGQLSLFAAPFHSNISRIEEDGATLFSVLDVFKHYGKAKNATTSWQTVLKRLEKQGFDRSREILDRIPDSGGRPSPYATFKTFLRIAQVTDFKEWEPIRQWMAETAHERVEEAANPELGIERATNRAVTSWKRQGHDDEWIGSRIQTINDRKAFADAISKHVTDLIPKQHYKEATNLVSKGLWGRDVPTLRDQMGLTSKQTPRDFQPRQGLLYNGLVESTVADIFAKYDDLKWIDASEIIKEVSGVFGFQADQLSRMLDIDLATGQSLLKDGQ